MKKRIIISTICAFGCIALVYIIFVKPNIAINKVQVASPQSTQKVFSVGKRPDQPPNTRQSSSQSENDLGQENPIGDETESTASYLQELHQQQDKELISKDKESLALPENGQKSLLTEQELENLHGQQNLELEQQAKDMSEIILESDDGSFFLTRKELQELHEKQELEISQETADTDIAVLQFEEGETGETGLTSGALKDLHEQQELEISQENNDMDKVILESADGRRLTKQDLIILHRQQEEGQ